MQGIEQMLIALMLIMMMSGYFAGMMVMSESTVAIISYGIGAVGTAIFGWYIAGQIIEGAEDEEDNRIEERYMG